MNIEKIVAGYNTNWKCASRLDQIGSHYIGYKAEMQGIEMCRNEESYTSKCDALALERFEDSYNRAKTRRVKRGLYYNITSRIRTIQRI